MSTNGYPEADPAELRAMVVQLAKERIIRAHEKVCEAIEVSQRVIRSRGATVEDAKMAGKVEFGARRHFADVCAKEFGAIREALEEAEVKVIHEVSDDAA